MSVAVPASFVAVALGKAAVSVAVPASFVAVALGVLAVAELALTGGREGRRASPSATEEPRRVRALPEDLRAADGDPSPTARTIPRRRPGGRLLTALAGIGRRLGPLAPPRDLAARLAAAGAPPTLTPGDVMAVKAGAALLGLVLAAPLAPALPGRLPLLALLAGPLAGFLAPDLWLAGRARKRGREMQRELPDLLDLMRVAMAAGLPVERALAEVARRHRGALAREWRTAARELTLGEPSAEVLKSLARRCPAEDMPAFVAALNRAARHGAPLAGILAAQAAGARAARGRRIREEAARAAPKIQLVVALLLVPSVMLLVAAALAASLLP